MSAPRAGATRWPLVFLLIGSGVVASMQSGKAPLAIAEIRVELGVGLVMAGLIVSAFSAMTGATGAFAGVVGDRRGHRRMMVVGYGFLVVGGLAGSFAPDGQWLLAMRVVEGIGFVAILVGSPALIARAARPDDQRLAFGLYGTNFPVGIALMMAVSPFILAPFGWRGLWLVNVAICVAMGLVLWLATRRVADDDADGDAADGDAAEGSTRSLRDLWEVLGAPGPWLAALAFVVYGTLWAAVVFWLPAYIVEQEGGSPLRAALVGAAVVIANAIGNVASARLNHRKPRGPLLIAIGGAGMAVLVLFIFRPGISPELRYALAFAFSLIGGLVPSSVLASVPVLVPRPELTGTMLGVIFQGAHLGTFLGPPVMAAFVALIVGDAQAGWSRAGPAFALFGVAVVMLAGLLWLAMRRAARRQEG